MELAIHHIDTERAALNAGTVGFDRNIFSGNPTLADLKDYKIKASPEEQGKLKLVIPYCMIHQYTNIISINHSFLGQGSSRTLRVGR